MGETIFKWAPGSTATLEFSTVMQEIGAFYLTVDLPRVQHRRFKIARTVAGTKMNDEIHRFIDRHFIAIGTPQWG